MLFECEQLSRREQQTNRHDDSKFECVLQFTFITNGKTNYIRNEMANKKFANTWNGFYCHYQWVFNTEAELTGNKADVCC